MSKKNFLFLVAVSITVQLSAQLIKAGSLHQPIVHCSTTGQANPSFELWMQNKIAEQRHSQSGIAQSYTLPIIFHIIYDDSTDGSNISQAAIQQQILQLNKDYANLSNSPYTVAANTGIQFALAQKNPSGTILAEPGIERINRSSRNWRAPGTKGWLEDFISDTLKAATIWDPEKYINVWVVPAISDGSINKILGYSTLPVSSTLSGLNTTNLETATNAGVVIDHATVGSLFRPQSCKTSYGKGKSLSHELGHFFGLRHIWGDGKCLTDYVDDTPTQEASNSGVPVHPKPDACGTPDEMFENYMDYSDDEVLNTFTAGQVARMQVVMQNSLRRKNLPLSDAGLVAVTGSNKIGFANCSGTLYTTETGTTGTYPRYKDISLNLAVEYQATGAATITIAVGGTATTNQYQLLTPSLSFAKGDAFKPVVIRLLDNEVADGDRELVINYTITGSGVVADTGSQSVIISETDDDDIIFAGKDMITILSENFENGSGVLGLPAGWPSGSSTNYPNVFVAGTNGNAGGSGKAAYITNNTSSKPNTYTKGTVGAAELALPQINPLQYQSIDTLKFKYRIKGSIDDHAYALYDIGDNSNLYFWGQQGLTGSGPYYGTGSVQSASLTLPAPGGINGKKFRIAFYWETGTGTNGGDPGFNVDDVSLTAHPYRIETEVSSSYGFDVLPNTINKFRSNNNRIVANIEGASDKISGVSAAVSLSGVGKAGILFDTLNINRTQKVITLLPTGAESLASYTATLYFTSAEMAVWGSKAASLSILKVKNGADLSGSLNASNAEILAPLSVDDKLSTDGYIAYQVKLTGFGQFMLTDNTASVGNPGNAPWVSIYPNPVQNNLFIKFAGTAAQNASIVITDMSGRIVYVSQGTVAGQKQINTTGLSSGVYIMKVQTSNHTGSFKIVKE